MKSFIEQAQRYGTYHVKPITCYTHFAGIPLMVFSLMVFLGFFHLVIPGVMDITLAGIATATLLIYYYYLHWRLALVITALFIILLWLATLVSYSGPTRFALWTFLISFLLGSTLQLVGHFIEGTRSAFKDNIWQALVAPLFLVAELFFMSGRMQGLKEQIYGIPRPVEPIGQSEIDKLKQDEL